VRKSMLSIALTMFLASTVVSLVAKPSDPPNDKDHKEKKLKIVTVPEPATLTLLGIGAGVGALAGIRKRFRR
jgi:hypothetical protein